ncbi:MAG TPA: hypothetical protein VIL37_06125 [Natronosporangium sp.]
MSMPGWLGRIAAGAIGGLVGGVVFGAVMQLTDTLELVASLVDQESIAVGWAVHLSIAVSVGMVYTFVFGLFAESLLISTVLSAFYGIIWWVLGGLTLMPLRLGMGLFVFDSAAWQSLAGHILYGVTLGVTYTVVVWLQGRSRARDGGRHRLAAVTASGPSPVTTPAPPPPADFPPALTPPAEPAPSPALFTPPAEPAPSPALFTPPAAGPRVGSVSRLPPAARSIRQRGRTGSDPEL